MFQVVNRERIADAYEKVRTALLARRNGSGHWTGRLASSALATATSIGALTLYRKNLRESDHDGSEDLSNIKRLIDRSVQWLLEDQNEDGGWGDTPESPSNISTSILVRCALQLSDRGSPQILQRLDRYIHAGGGIGNIQERYGSDRTFSIPILTNGALAGLVSWDAVPALPFELAWFPRSLFRLLKLPVVSYAIPALVAIGLVRFVKAPPRNVIVKMFRRFARNETLKKVRDMQPESGGFLEAAPLTGFVVMSLCESGLAHHPIVRRGVGFLLETVRDDASWPVDTNLACWATTLSINALAECRGATETRFLRDEAPWEWVLSVQQRKPHPFTGAAPGGWPWTDLSGGVPDVDDTSGAVLALSVRAAILSAQRDTTSPVGTAGDDDVLRSQAVAGLRWLLDLQNRDGGWPTFCRGWNRFPFDRSGVDLTAHALRAILAWWNIFREKEDSAGANDFVPGIITSGKPLRALRRGLDFLFRTQDARGAWIPLWFGNQHRPGEDNPWYGTAKVLQFLAEAKHAAVFSERRRTIDEAVGAALRFFVEHQNDDGGFGGEGTNRENRERLSKDTSSGAAFAHGESGPVSSVEETASVVAAVAPFLADPAFSGKIRGLDDMYEKSLHLLLTMVEQDRYARSAPIGLYFTKLWYDEELYPLVFTCSALARAWNAAERIT